MLDHSDTPILFCLDGIPPDERDQAALVECNLLSFASEIRNFEAALALFDYCEPKANPTLLQPTNRYGDWLFIAARDGAMSAYHAYVAFQGARDNAYKCSSLMRAMNRMAFKAAAKQFDAAFPNLVDMRDAIAHSTLKLKTQQKLNEHPPINGLIITSCLNGRVFSATWEKKLVSYELSQESLERLKGIRSAIWVEFRKAEKATLETSKALSKRHEQQP